MQNITTVFHAKRAIAADGIDPSGGKATIPSSVELGIAFGMFGWFIAHYMWNVVPDSHPKRGVCPLEEAVGNANIRLTVFAGFYKTWLNWYADALAFGV